MPFHLCTCPCQSANRVTAVSRDRRAGAGSEAGAGLRVAPPRRFPEAASGRGHRSSLRWRGSGRRGAYPGARWLPAAPRAPSRAPCATMAQSLRSWLGGCLLVSGEGSAGRGRRAFSGVSAQSRAQRASQAGLPARRPGPALALRPDPRCAREPGSSATTSGSDGPKDDP